MAKEGIKNPYKSQLLMGFLFYLIQHPENAYIKAIADNYNYSSSMVSNYLNTLQEENLVKREKEGKRNYYKPQPDKIVEQIVERSGYLQDDLEPPLDNERFINMIYASFIGSLGVHTGEFKDKNPDKLGCNKNFEQIAKEIIDYVRYLFDEVAGEKYGHIDNWPEPFFEINQFLTRLRPSARIPFLEIIKQTVGVNHPPGNTINITDFTKGIEQDVKLKIDAREPETTQEYREFLTFGTQLGPAKEHLQTLKEKFEEVDKQLETVWALFVQVERRQRGYIDHIRELYAIDTDTLWNYIQDYADLDLFQDKEEIEAIIEKLKDKQLIVETDERTTYTGYKPANIL